MPTPIEQALITLLPTQPTIPQPLLSLSTSLLAQSRAKATTLKPDEEIARTFAVCHVAVLRLKQQLGIDRVNVKPPVQPRVYEKLLAYLESALGSVGGTPKGTPRRTPRGKGDVAAGEETPTKARSSPANFVDGARGIHGSAGRGSAVAASGGRRSTRLPPKTVDARLSRLSVRDKTDTAPSAGDGVEVPAHARTMTTAICAAFETPEADHHILAACVSILNTRGWQEAPETATDSSPILSRKRTRTSTSLENETFHEPDNRSSKRRRTGIYTSTITSSAPTSTFSDLTSGPVTSSTLPALITALSLYTIFTLRGQQVGRIEYTLAPITAINAIHSAIPEKTLDIDATKHQIAAFLEAAHVEGWLSQPWALDMQAEGATRTHSHPDAEVDVEMEETEDTSLETELVAAEEYQEAEAEAEEGDENVEEEEEEDCPHRRTPRKTSSRPAKTPLRRREKHASRPASSTNLDIDPNASNRAGLKSGLGTMFQDAVDWLSAERCADYQGWKAWIQEEIARVEREGGMPDSGAVEVA